MFAINDMLNENNASMVGCMYHVGMEYNMHEWVEIKYTFPQYFTRMGSERNAIMKLTLA